MKHEGKEAGTSAWERGYEEHELAQLRRLARMPLTEKLRWLEESHRLIGHLQRGPGDDRPERE